MFLYIILDYLFDFPFINLSCLESMYFSYRNKFPWMSP